jgi:serine phosphatase RsbU (regulator of sigma subunit)
MGEAMKVNRQSTLLPPNRVRILASVVAGVLSFPVAVLAARVPAMAHLGGLPFVAVVVVCTAIGRLAVGVASAIVATLLLDLYVIPPTGRLDLQRVGDYVAVGIFAFVSVATAIVVSHIERISAERKRANARLQFVASSLQRRLLPTEIPRVPPFEVEVGYWPAGEGIDVGGDFYDVFQPREGQLVVVVGDVSGKGPEAAAFVGVARHVIRTLAASHDDPAAVLHRLNDSLLEEMSDDRFCTVCIATIDAGLNGSAHLRVACAGHPAPYIIRGTGAVREASSSGTLLGLLKHVEFEEYSTNLGPEDTLVMYTDGLYERPQGSAHDERDVASLLQGTQHLPPRGVVHRIAGDVDAFSGLLLDDTALIVIRNTAHDRLVQRTRLGDPE